VRAREGALDDGGTVGSVARNDVPSVEPPAAAPAADDVDVVSFDQLFAREYGPMVRLATLLLGNEAEAEEVVQEAFAVVHERWARLSRPGGYLRGCVVNRARDLLRRRAVVQRLRRTHAIEPPEPADLGVDHLFDALAILPPKRRIAVVLRYYEGRTEAEIAELLGVRPGTVKSMVHRALAQLREVIEP
jgi:RNA polymerase sigma-70 factor (sigma-E family)